MDSCNELVPNIIFNTIKYSGVLKFVCTISYSEVMKQNIEPGHFCTSYVDSIFNLCRNAVSRNESNKKFFGFPYPRPLNFQANWNSLEDYLLRGPAPHQKEESIH